jgi:hypothetical protein
MAAPEQFIATGYPPKDVFGAASLTAVGVLQASGVRHAFGAVGQPSTTGRSWSDPQARVELPAIPAPRFRRVLGAVKTTATRLPGVLSVGASVAAIVTALRLFGII